MSKYNILKMAEAPSYQKLSVTLLGVREMLLPSSTSIKLCTGRTAGAPSGKDQSLQCETTSRTFFGTTGDFGS